MSTQRGRFERWSLFGWLVAGLAAMGLAIFATAGTGEAGVRMAVRATARTSVLLFALAFTASSLRSLAPVPATAWLLRNRRQLGLAMAVSHFAHLAALVALVPRTAEPVFQPVAVVGGGLAYVFLAAMAATSSDAAQAWLGMRRWRLLHRIGSWWVWIIFAQSYLPRAARDPAYLPLAAVVVVIPALRLAARLRARRRVQRPVAPSLSTQEALGPGAASSSQASDAPAGPAIPDRSVWY